MLDEKDLGPEAFRDSTPEHEADSEVGMIDTPAATGGVAMNGSVELAETEHEQIPADNQPNGDVDNAPASEEPKGIVFDKPQERWLGDIFTDEQLQKVKGLAPEAQDSIVDGLLLHYSTLVTARRTTEIIERNSKLISLFLRGHKIKRMAKDNGLPYPQVATAMRNIPSSIASTLSESSLEHLIEVAGKKNEETSPEEQDLNFEESYNNYYGISPPRASSPERKADKKESTSIKTNLVFRFSVGDKSITATFRRGKGFDQMSMQQRIVLGIGLSSTCVQTPEHQKIQIRNIAAKLDKDKETFDQRFEEAFQAEVDGERTATNGDGMLSLTDDSVELLEGYKEIKIVTLPGILKG